MLSIPSKKNLYSIISFFIFLCLIIGQNTYANKSTEPVFKITKSATEKHNNASGGKGKDNVILKKPKIPDTSCAKLTGIKVYYTTQRFGKVTKPPKAETICTKKTCKVAISWEHAPAGCLEYHVKAKWKIQSSGCPSS